MIIRFSFLVDNGECYHTGKPGIGMEDFYYLMAGDLDECGDVWEKLSNHYHKNKRFCFEIEYGEAVTIRDIQKMISDRIGFEWSRFLNMPMHTAFFCDGQIVHINDHEVKLHTIRKWYDISKEFVLYFILCDQAGTIWLDDGLRYYMHSRESGRHNTPHIHVDYRNEEGVSLSLVDGRVLDGRIPAKAMKKARKRILENQRFLLECWNKYTDGLQVDIDHFFGIISIEVG